MKVKDIMSKNPLTITSNTRIKEVTEIFERVPYLSIFIVDSDKLVGIVTRNDLRVRKWDYLLSDPVSIIMSKGVFKINKEADVEKAIAAINYYDLNSLAVMDGERLCGIITKYDIKTKYNATYTSNNFKKTSTSQFKSNKKTNQNTNLVPIVALIIFFVIIIVLIQRSWIACPEGERAYNGVCIKTIPCQDGTLSPDCSNNKPYQCLEGILIENASACGCPDGTVPNNEKCMDPYMTNPSIRQFYFVLHGKSDYINTTLYGGLNDYLSTQLFWTYTYPSDETPPTQQQLSEIYANQWINQPDQDRLINDLVNSIENYTSDKQDQARIAVSIVQNIPYDWDEYTQNINSNNLARQKYPYQVLYSNAGVCQDKSELLALLLEKLGFGVALLEFSNKQHMAVGISCPVQYSIDNNGYCFIESTQPNIITYSTGTYIGNIKLGSPTYIIKVSDGLSFDASQEYADAKEYEYLLNVHLTSSDYSKWLSLRKEYGLEEKECTDPATHLCNGECWKGCPDHYVVTCTAQGSQCNLDPNNCPSDMQTCNGKCWQRCPYGSTPSCNSNGLICTTTMYVGQSCDGVWCNNQCYQYCPSGTSQDCRSDGLHCTITQQTCDGTWCQGQCYTPCPQGSASSCESDGLHCTTTTYTGQSCAGVWCNGECYTPCPLATTPQCDITLHCIQH